MCGRFSLFTNPAAYLERLGVEFDLEWVGRYNVSPNQSVFTVKNTEGVLKPESMVWGLSPNWSKSALNLINARSDSLSVKPSFFQSFRLRRCIILGDGFFDWEKKEKYSIPHYFQLKNKGVFAFAGLYDIYNNISTTTIITSKPNELVSKIHDRMPVILDKGGVDTWLSPGFEINKLMDVLMPYSSDDMIEYTVSDYVNDVTHDDEKVIEPYFWPQKSLNQYM